MAALCFQFVPSSIVYVNRVPKNYVKMGDGLGQHTYYDVNTERMVTYPRIGAFEIQVFDRVLYSKLEVNAWPHLARVVESLKNIVHHHLRIQAVRRSNARQNTRLPSLANIPADKDLRADDYYLRANHRLKELELIKDRSMTERKRDLSNPRRKIGQSPHTFRLLVVNMEQKK